MAQAYPENIGQFNTFVPVYSQYENWQEARQNSDPPTADSVSKFKQYLYYQSLRALAYAGGPVFGPLVGVFMWQKQREGILVTPTNTAQEAWEKFINSGGTVSENGLASGIPRDLLITEAVICLQNAIFEAAPILGVSPEAIAVSLAANYGIAIGEGIYYTNPDFWTGLVDSINDYRVRDKKVLPVVQWGQSTYVDSRLEEAARAYLGSQAVTGDFYWATKINLIEQYKNEYGIDLPVAFATGDGSQTGNGYSYISAPNIAGNYTETELWPNGYMVRVEYVGTKVSSIFFFKQGNHSSEKPFGGRYRLSKTIEGLETMSWIENYPVGNYNYNSEYNISWYPLGYFSRVNTVSFGSMPPAVVGVSIEMDDIDIVKILFDVINDGYWRPGVIPPTGTTPWAGRVDTTPQSIQVVVDEDGTTQKFVPIAIPPYSTNFPELSPITNPNPTIIVNPVTQIVPYAQPEYVPTPVPDYTPTSNPTVNPSIPSTPRPQINYPNSPASKDISDLLPTLDNTTPPPYSSSGLGGFINVYNPSPDQLYSFARWLWVTYSDLSIPKLFNNPFDGVVSLHEIYVSPPQGETVNIRSGFLESTTAAPLISNRYIYFSCGSITVPELYGNYLDFSPYTKVWINLPFIGFQELEADDIIGRSVNVTYGVDIYSGACIAQIAVAKKNFSGTVYQFTGNCAVEHPISGGSKAQIFSAILNAGVSAVGSAITGALSKSKAGKASDFASAAESLVGITNAKSSVTRSGTFGANFGALGPKTPYLVIKRPIQVVIPNYNEIYGYQAHKLVRIGNCTGYVKCREVRIDSATATDEEKSRIEELLKSGVYVS